MKTAEKIKNLAKKIGIKTMLSLFFLSLVLFNVQTVSADEVDNELLKKRNELNQIESQVKELRDYITAKQQEIISLNNQLTITDSRIELIQLQLKATQIDIEKTAAEIEKTETEIVEKEAEIDKQKELIGKVIRKIYMEKDTNIVSIIVESKTFSELVEKTEYLARVRAQLKDTLDKLKVLKIELEQEKEDLEIKMEELEELRQEKELEESGLEEQKYTKIKLIENTQGQEAEFQSRLAQAQAEEQAVTAEIVRLVQEQARRQRQSGVEGRAGRGDIVMVGGFTYPLAGANRISVIGGDYMDPAYGMGFPHRGIDLAASQGTPIYSAGAGVVVAAHDSGNAGLSYIAIDHGNGLITKYLHMSAIYVLPGDVVNAGDVIGLSGGTPGTRGAGLFTTGPHLHFEINDYQGNPINPHNYLSFLPPLY